MNELTERSPWHTVWQHLWKRPAHINLLEGAVSEVWEERAARRGGGRIVGLADSRVTLCSRLKGRSSSRAIRASLLRRAPVVLAGGVHPAYLLTPSRLNPSDDPSRFVPLNSAARQRPIWLGRGDTTSKSQAYRPLNAEDPADLDFLCSRAASRAPEAAWGGLTLHFLKLSVLWRASEQPIPRTPAFLEVGPALRAHAFAATLSRSNTCLEFDSTRGFPGEGPLRRGPQESNAERAKRRAGVGELLEFRPTAPTTDSARKRLLQQLDHSRSTRTC